MAAVAPQNDLRNHCWYVKTMLETHESLAGLSLPSGSAIPAICRASEFAKSAFPGVTASIKQLGFLMRCIIKFLIRVSISEGWSPTGTLVIPGRSTKPSMLQRRHFVYKYGTSRQEVASNERLQHARFAATLTSYNHHFW
ncbi:hypothetical protein Leryth_007212 [Lithospermum erythrorhizon]|nr:hypothetical protein Leryth_007212 [Lithospermum erythrorhizon]